MKGTFRKPLNRSNTDLKCEVCDTVFWSGNIETENKEAAAIIAENGGRYCDEHKI